MNYICKFTTHQNKNESIKTIFLFFLLIIFQYSICIDCTRDKQILKNNECVSIYCQPKEFENNICEISNIYIKSQWLNNIHIFNNSEISNICSISGRNGNLFLIAQEFTTGDKYLYGFSKDGNGLFINNINKTKTSFETFDFPEKQFTEIFQSIEIDNDEYLLSTQSYNQMFLIDYKNKKFTNFTFDSYARFSENIFKLNGYDDENLYFTSYIYCNGLYDLNECYLGLRIFKLNFTDMLILLENQDKIQVHYKSKLSCFQNEDLYIQCIYSTMENINNTEKYSHIISLFNFKTLKMEYNEVLEENFKIDGIFDNTIQLKGNIFVTGYQYFNKRNVIKLLFKKFKIISNSENDKTFLLEDYLPNIEHIDINDDNIYLLERGLAKKNSMTKISETKFAILLSEFKDSNIPFNRYLIILIINIFDNSYISIRHYKIDFSLYNLLIVEDLRGYNLNNFFGILFESVVATTKFIPRAGFVTFGYVNSTIDDIPIDKNLKENNTNSIIKIRDYISEIENNLFLYKIIGVKIIELPDRNISGYFVINNTNKEINVDDILNIDTILRFILLREMLSGEEFTISFAAVVKEPDFDLMNMNAERVDIYPVNNTELERKFYNPKTFIGRVINYKFDLSCYDSCSSCYMLSNNP